MCQNFKSHISEEFLDDILRFLDVVPELRIEATTIVKSMLEQCLRRWTDVGDEYAINAALVQTRINQQNGADLSFRLSVTRTEFRLLAHLEEQLDRRCGAMSA